MITSNVNKGSVLFTQEWLEEAPAEPAILLQPYGDIISIEQGSNSISLNYHSVKEFIKALKLVAENEPA